MITYSDNDAAAPIYARVGDAGMAEVAERRGMRDFEVTPGYWGGAQMTAGDLARFFAGLDRNLVRPYRAFGKRLLANITSDPALGHPGGRRRRTGASTSRAAGGPPATEETSGPVTHQAALLRHRYGQRLAIAVLTDQSPGTTGYGTIEGITRGCSGDPRTQRWPARWPCSLRRCGRPCGCA